MRTQLLANRCRHSQLSAHGGYLTAKPKNWLCHPAGASVQLLAARSTFMQYGGGQAWIEARPSKSHCNS